MTLEFTRACRSCGGARLSPVLDLGEQPLANAYATALQHPPRYPLSVLSCDDCTLLQLSAKVDPHEMFDDYLYLSSYSTGMVEEMDRLAEEIVDERRLGDRALVVEVASNDGYLLQHYLRRGVNVLGIEPAARPAELARAAGIETRVEYFGLALAQQLVSEGHRADVLHANNVLAHVPDVNDFVAGIATLLAEGGQAVVETPYALDMIASNAFDTIYHEHVFYYSATALQLLFARHGLTIAHAKRIPYHAGSLRLRVERGSRPGVTAEALLAEELAAGVGTARWYGGFADAVDLVCTGLLAWLAEQREAGRTVAGYGAAAKGTVLLNRAGVGPEQLAFVVDRNPVKQGLHMPGTEQPIVGVDALLARQPDSLLVLAWNHAAEVYGQLDAYRAAGGELFVAVPEMRLLP